MKQNAAEKNTPAEKSRHIAEVFDQLDDKSQEYMEDLTATLAAIHQKAPENQKK
jgi:hypothetical protein